MLDRSTDFVERFVSQEAAKHDLQTADLDLTSVTTQLIEVRRLIRYKKYRTRISIDGTDGICKNYSNKFYHSNKILLD